MNRKPNENKPVMLHITVAIITGFLGISYLSMSWSGPWWVFLSYSVFALISAILKLGWIIPFEILGVVFGFMAMPGVGSRDPILTHGPLIVICLGIGMFIGFIFDLPLEILDDEALQRIPNESEPSTSEKNNLQ
ncbi:hypothetical protein N9153_01780 [Planctomicrobium sp.]|nr:hypothetical protein [bacterium]MDB4439634.1 hypothetical protein [Planctomicrobium sp.]